MSLDSIRNAAATKWEAARPTVIGLAVGLIAGPIISGMAGFQVRTSTAEAATRAGFVDQQAGFCAERARATMPAPAAGAAPAAPLDWQKRNDLARQFAAAPGAAAADPDVVFACSSRLGR